MEEMFIQRPLEVLGLLRKVGWCAKCGHMQDHISLGKKPDLTFDVYKKCEFKAACIVDG